MVLGGCRSFLLLVTTPEVTGSNSVEVSILSGFSTQSQKNPSTTARIIAYLITSLIKQYVVKEYMLILPRHNNIFGS